MPKDLARLLQEALIEHGKTLVTAESCTGGLIGARLTAVPGSSDYYRGGAVVYSNELKTLLLGVSPKMLGRVGAVSRQVATAMARGARKNLGGDWAVAVTGVAGPGASDKKPAGLVFIAVAGPGRKAVVEEWHFEGGRAKVRQQTVERALELLWEMIQ